MSKSFQKHFVLSTGQENVDPVNFTFRQRTLGLDWRKIACIDADDIRATGNVELLQDLIFTITFCNIDAEFAHSSVADKNLLKLFKTSQLIIEYLIHCQECLLTSFNKTSQETILLREQIAALQLKLDADKEFIVKAKKECHKRRLLAAQYQAELLALKNGNVPKEQFPCGSCPKIFLSNYYLKLHMAKRHNVEMASPEPIHVNKPPMSDENPSTPIKYVQQNDERRHQEEIEQLKAYFSREMTEMSQKMAEWQRLAEQLRNVHQEAVVINQPQTVKSISPTPAPQVTQDHNSPVKQSNFGQKLEDDMEQEQRLLQQLGSHLDQQFNSFAGQLDQRVLQLSRGIADQLSADSKRHVEVLSEQISGLMGQLAKEREAKLLAEQQRDEALNSRQRVTYIQPPVRSDRQNQSLFDKHRAESQSTPALALPSSSTPLQPVPSSISHSQVPTHTASSKTPSKPEKKKSFFGALTEKFKSPKKSTSTPSLNQQQMQQQQQTPTQQPTQPHQSSTLPRPATAGIMNKPDFYSNNSAPALPKVSYQEPIYNKPRQSEQPFLVALMEDSPHQGDTDSELTSRPSSSSPLHQQQPQQIQGDKWQNAEPIPIAKPGEAVNSAKALGVTPTDASLQASMTLPTLSATGGNLASTGPGDAIGSMYLSVNTATSTSVSGLQMRPKSADGDSSLTTTDLDQAVRRKMIEQLDQELSRHGIAKDEKRLDNERYEKLRSQLEVERQRREFTHPDFYSNTRNQILSTIDKLARDKAAGGSTFRSEMSRTESSQVYRQLQMNQPALPEQQIKPVTQPIRGTTIGVTSANATPRADRSEIMATESQWTSEEDGSDVRVPVVINSQIPSLPTFSTPANNPQVASKGLTGIPVLKKTETPQIMQFSNPKTQPQQQQHNQGNTSPSGTTDDVSTMDVTSSIQENPRGFGVASTNDFDETDSDDMLIKQEMARLNIEASAPGSASTAKKSATLPAHLSQPTFGSRPASSLTGISDYDTDYRDLGP